MFSVCERIDITLLIRSSFARHTLDTLNTLEVGYSYVGKNRWPAELKIYNVFFFSIFVSCRQKFFSNLFNKFNTVILNELVNKGEEKGGDDILHAS